MGVVNTIDDSLTNLFVCQSPSRIAIIIEEV